MIKRNILISSLLITSTLIILLIISIWANYSKNSILKSELRKNLKYDTINIDNNFVKILIPNEKLSNTNKFYNKFANEEFTNHSILIETKNCEHESIYIISRYNNKNYSDIYKIHTSTQNLYVNIHNSKNNLDFKYFEIHKNNLNCINKIYEVLDKKLPFTYHLIQKKNIDKKNIKASNLKIKEKGFKILKKDEKLLIFNNEIKLRKNYGNDNGLKIKDSELYKYYFRNINKQFIIKDLLFTEIQNNKTANIQIQCKVNTGHLLFFIFDYDNLQPIEFDHCSDNKNIVLNLPINKNLKFLISSRILPTNSLEMNFKINLKYF